MTMPRCDRLISIVTACLNSAEVLVHCMESVAAQSVEDWEHIVIDGGSTDGTVELLRARSDSRLRWISEPDGGIADAMNKGIALARGRFVLFLQADDRLAGSGALERCLAEVKQCPEAVWLFPVMTSAKEENPAVVPVRQGRLWRKMPACHQGIVFPRGAFAKVGDYDASFSLCMDYEWLLRARDSGIIFVRGKTVPALYSVDGQSSSRKWPEQRLRFEEERKAHFLHARSSGERLLYRLYWSLYLPYRRLRSFL